VYKIVLVDDEAIVRETIKEQIRWQEHGFECIGDCGNGIEALELMEKVKPDVVLSDIYMPFMDGLELTRRVVAEYPGVKVIILTGYDDFEYARQAVKLKASDFILKPITAAELRKVLDQLKTELDEETAVLEHSERLKQLLNESLPLLKERFLERLVTSPLGVKEIEERLAYFRLSLPGPEYIELAVDIENFEPHERFQSDSDRELLRFAVYNVVSEIVSRETGAVAFRNREELVIAILSGAQPELLQERAQEVAEDIVESLRKYLKASVSVGIGVTVRGWPELRSSHATAISALDYRFLLGSNRVINIRDMEGNRKLAALPSKDWERQFIAAIKTGSTREVHAVIEQVIRECKTALFPMGKCYLVIQRLIIGLLHAIQELEGSEAEIFGEQANPVMDIYQCKTLDEIESWLKEACRKVSAGISEMRDDFCKLQVQRAAQYIKEMYADEKLTLKSICHYVNMSTSYFSSVFKAHTGKTFIEYLTCVRMEKAKELLKYSTLKTYEIASNVGYGDPHYFSALFKKHTGDTPTEYRQTKA
jgi:two-component system response regulator YesN